MSADLYWGKELLVCDVPSKTAAPGHEVPDDAHECVVVVAAEEGRLARPRPLLQPRPGRHHRPLLGRDMRGIVA
jgi:hypothetical protein